MYLIQETRDVNLRRLGLRLKVVRCQEGKAPSVVGFFSDYGMAAKVRDTLNQPARYCS